METCPSQARMVFYVDPGPQQVRCRRVADYMRADPFTPKRRYFARSLLYVALNYRMNAEPCDELSSPVEEHVLFRCPTLY